MKTQSDVFDHRVLLLLLFDGDDDDDHDDHDNYDDERSGKKRHNGEKK